MNESRISAGAAGAVAGLAVLAGMGLSAGAALAQVQVQVQAQAQGLTAEQAGAQTSLQAATVQLAAPVSPLVTLSTVEGTFSFTQGEVSSIAELARGVYQGSKVLCASGPELGAAGATEASGEGAAAAEGAVDYGAWTVSVGGDVANALSATVGELAEDCPFQQVMGCSCAGNPSNGRASGNALVTGVSLRDLIDLVQPEDGVNAVTFVSSDGYRVSLPLSYVKQRACVLVVEVNGEAMGDALGVANQVWLGSTSARYFAQNVVEILLTAEEVAPAAPGAVASEGVNLPNVSVVEGSAA